ncbi:MAG: FAD:protein FMN transferase [Planctomycetaceae bacterium]|nr:MAG: FAD:protein FMN transferase [Planctomycetaceae bacterium]
MSEPLVTEITRRAMATEFGVVIAGRPGNAVEVAIEALDDLGRLESLMSVHQPASQVSEINRLAGVRPVRVAPELIEVLTRAVAIAELTGGAFDVTAGPLVRCWGFTQRRGQKPSDDAIREALASVGSHRLRIDTAKQTVMLADAGMEINLGGIGKGFALDQIVSRLEAHGCHRFLVHGGRSTVVARGSGCDEPEQGWRVALEHPLRTGIRLGEVRLRDQALSTSGSGKQFFHWRGRRLGHVLDPRTGYPTGDMLSLTVLTESGTDADALSTACFVEGWRTTAMRIGNTTTGPPPTTPPTSRRPHWPTAAIAVLPREQGEGVEIRRWGADLNLDWTPAPTTTDQPVPKSLK